MENLEVANHGSLGGGGGGGGGGGFPITIIRMTKKDVDKVMDT